MTGKRFQIDDDGDITEFGTDGKWIDCWQYANGKHWESLCDKLNHLYEKNEQLKQSYKEFEDECQSTFNAMSRKQNDLYRKNFKLKEENEQLKQFKEYVFDLIDKEIKETKEIFEDGKIDLMTHNDAMIILTGLKEQLKGDDE